MISKPLADARWRKVKKEVKTHLRLQTFPLLQPVLFVVWRSFQVMERKCSKW